MHKRSNSVVTSSSAKRSKLSHTTAQPRIVDFFTAVPNTKGRHLGKLPQKPTFPEIIDADAFQADELLATPESLSSGSTSEPSISLQGLPPTFQTSVPTVVSFAHINLTSDVIKYTHPHQLWTFKGVPYSFLAHTLATISQTRSRISIINALTNSLRTIIHHDSASLLPALYLLSNTLAPPYAAVEMGLGPALISRSIQQVSGLTPIAFKRLYNITGDAGDVAFTAKSNIRTLLPHPPLVVTSVYESLLNIAQSKGPGAARSKQKIVETLLIAAHGEEIRFLVRTLSQNLRVGAVRTSILTALSRAMVLTPLTNFGICHQNSIYHMSTDILFQSAADEGKSRDVKEEIHVKFLRAENIIKRIYVQHPNYGDIITGLLTVGLDGLGEKVQLTKGIPLHPTLGSPTRSLQEIYDLLGDRPFSAEFKYDGQRAQIHGYLDGINIRIKIFSRHLEDMTDKYPDVVFLAQSFFNINPRRTSFILDSEIVAIDPDNGNPKPFQELSARAQKYVLLNNISVAVCVYVFDLMYLDEESLLTRSFRERRALLHKHFLPFTTTGMLARFKHVESCESEGGRTGVEIFWEKAIASRCEGLMVKLLDNIESVSNVNAEQVKSRRKRLIASYEPDKRTSAWLKLKRDYVDGLGDTLDLVPIGAWHGNGRKAGWWSPILLGLWDQDTGRFVGVCKCISGFPNAFYKSLAERYQLSVDSETCSAQPLWECDFGGFKPEVYLKPQEVWEIRGADITLSPVSLAAKGVVSPVRGLSIRFPRFLRVREDKSIEQATTPRNLVSMWTAQQMDATAKGRHRADDGDLVDIVVDDSEVSEQGEE
ncbi:ATP-dependent DNA ligase, partial [Collybia nuda]